MEKKLGVVVLLILLVVPMILAATTTINVKTLPNHDVMLKILDPYPNEGESNVIEYLEGTSDETGLASFTSFASKGAVDIIVIVEKDGNRVEINEQTIHKFDKKPTGGIINLEVKEQPVVTEPEVNETVEENETENIEENATEEIVEEQAVVKETKEEKESGGVIGAIVGGGKAVITSKVTYYIVGGIFVLALLFFVVRITRNKLRSKKGGTYLDFKIRGDRGEDSRDKIRNRDKALRDAERKIEEAKAELDDIKNRKSKLQEARERFERDKKELERLERD